jgi:predicted DNA-binding transcriptional regulator YafY
MTRDEYTLRCRETARRGMDLPWAKLTPLEVDAIRSAARQRENLRQHIRDNLSNAALAKSFGVHPRTIEKVLSGVSWGHV